MDSVQAFSYRYNLQGKTTITERDSIYNHERARTKRGKQQPYLKDGYECICPK